MFMWIKELSFTENNFSPSFNKKRKVTVLRSKCFCYEEGEKSSKFFLNLEKRRVIQGQIRTYSKQKRNYASEQD